MVFCCRITGDKLVRDVHLFGKSYKLTKSKKRGRQKGGSNNTPTPQGHCDRLVVMSVSLDPPIKSQVTFHTQGWKPQAVGRWDRSLYTHIS